MLWALCEIGHFAKFLGNLQNAQFRTVPITNILAITVETIFAHSNIHFFPNFNVFSFIFFTPFLMPLFS